MYYMTKKGKEVSSIYFKLQHQLWKTNYSFDDFKQGRMALSCNKKLFELSRGITSKHDGNF